MLRFKCPRLKPLGQTRIIWRAVDRCSLWSSNSSVYIFYGGECQDQYLELSFVTVQVWYVESHIIGLGGSGNMIASATHSFIRGIYKGAKTLPNSKLISLVPEGPQSQTHKFYSGHHARTAFEFLRSPSICVMLMALKTSCGNRVTVSDDNAVPPFNLAPCLQK